MPLSLHDRFARSLRSLQLAVSSSARDTSWRAELTAVIDDLKSMNRSTESAFLAVSGSLSDFLTDSRRLHSNIDAVTALVSAEQARNAGRSLLAVQDHARDTERRAKVRVESLQSLGASAASIRSGFSSFEKIALSFHITAVLARIETAHLSMSVDISRQDLSNLADEVLASSAAIQERATLILEAATEFDTRIRTTLAEVSRFEGMQLKQLPELLASVDRDLKIVETRQAAAATASAAIAADLNLVIRDLNGVAMSVQFHDITRQQIEHVWHALEHLLETAPRGALTEQGAAILKLQRAQLEAAATSFTGSAAKIVRELEGVSTHAARMTESTRAILGTESGSSFFGDLGRRLAAIVQALSEFQAQDGSTMAMIAEFQCVADGLRDSITELHALECQLNRISLNALISASHLGEVGEPLNVVAAGMQSLERECSARSTEAESALTRISQGTQALSHSDEDNGAGVALVETLRGSMTQLDEVSRSSESAVASVSGDAHSLLDKLGEVRDHLAVARGFEETVQRTVKVFERLERGARSAWGEARAAQPAASAGGHYTMETERLVHQAVTSGDAGAATESDAGGDVEFF